MQGQVEQKKIILVMTQRIHTTQTATNVTIGMRLRHGTEARSTLVRSFSICREAE
jgi:hypothetical protein